MSQHVGDSRDCALLQFLLDLGFTYQYYRDEWPHQKHVEYKSVAAVDANNQYTATVIKIPDANVYRVYVKGGLQYVLSHSTKKIPNHPEESLGLESHDKKKIEDECVQLQRNNMTVIGFAMKNIPVGKNIEQNNNNKKLDQRTNERQENEPNWQQSKNTRNTLFRNAKQTKMQVNLSTR